MPSGAAGLARLLAAKFASIRTAHIEGKSI
jgi:hypothetical protein